MADRKFLVGGGKVRGWQRGFTLVELLVVLLVVGLLAALLMPVFSSVRERGRQSVCLSHLRQLGQAVSMYRQDYGAAPSQRWEEPPGHAYYNDLGPYVKDPRLWLCPSSNPGPRIQEVCSYNYRLDGDRVWDGEGGGALGSRTVVFYCQNHRKPAGLSRTEKERGLPPYEGVYGLLRLDESAELLPAPKVKVSYQPVRSGRQGVFSSREMMEFPE